MAVIRVRPGASTRRNFAVRWDGGTRSEDLTEQAAIARMEFAAKVRAILSQGRIPRCSRWPLAPVTDKVTRPRLMHGLPGRLEIWGATCGDWGFDREDGEPDTPWYGYHRPSVADGSFTGSVLFGGSLRELRIQVAIGEADEALATAKARKAAEKANPAA
jgi:hypothetical protein